MRSFSLSFFFISFVFCKASFCWIWIICVLKNRRKDRMHIHRSPRKRTGLSLTLPFSLGEYPRSLTHFTAMKLKNGGRGWGCSNALEQFLTLILIIEKLDQWYAVVYNKYLPVTLPLSLGFLDEPIPKGILNLFFKSFQDSTKYSSWVQSCISSQGEK